MNLLLHGIGDEDARQPDRRRRRARRDPGDALRDGAHQSAVRPQVVDDDRQRRGRGRARGPRRRARRLLGDDLEQAAQLRPARQDAARRSTAAPRWSCPTTCCSRAARARRSAGGCSTSATCTRCCGCRPASSTPRASRRTCCSSTASRRAETPWTSELWVYDLRTNMHFTLKQNPLRAEHLDDFVDAFSAGRPRERASSPSASTGSPTTSSSRATRRTSTSPGSDDSLEDTENLPPPEVIAQEIVEDLEAALVEFSAVAKSLAEKRNRVSTARAVADDRSRALKSAPLRPKIRGNSLPKRRALNQRSHRSCRSRPRGQPSQPSHRRARGRARLLRSGRRRRRARRHPRARSDPRRAGAARRELGLLLPRRRGHLAAPRGDGARDAGAQGRRARVHALERACRRTASQPGSTCASTGTAAS